MSDVTRILSRIEEGDPAAAEQLLPLVNEELRQLAAARLQRERPDQTLQATALVHEAYPRLVDTERTQHWDSRGHFFAAAAEAMRRILVENALQRTVETSGKLQRHNLDALQLAENAPADDLLTLEDALTEAPGSTPRRPIW